LEEEEKKKIMFMKQIGEDDDGVDFDHEEINAQNDF